MRRLLLLVPLAALAACAAPEGQRVDDKIRRVELAMQNRDEVAQMALREMKDQVDHVTQDNGQLRNQVAVLRADVDRLERQIAEGALRPGAGQPTPAALDAPTLEQRVAQVVPLLRDPNFQAVPAVIHDLTPQAERAAASLFEELRRTPRDYTFSRRVEEIVGAFPAGAVRGPLERALEEPATRMAAVRIAERQRDAGHAAALRAYLTSNDPGFQFAVALALVACGDDQGAPYLLQALSAEQRERRILAYETLRRRYALDGFGYDAWKAPAENAGAVQAWQDWWDRRRAGATDPP